EAIATLEDGCRRTPHDPVVHAALGELWEDQGDVAKAEICYRDAIEAAPKYGRSYALLATLQRAQGQHDQALLTIQEGCERASQDAILLLTAGRIHEQRGEFAQGEAYYRRALAAAPAFGPAYAGFAKFLRAHGQPDDALAMLQEGCRQAPQSATPFVAL